MVNVKDKRTPTDWHNTNRSKSIILAANIQKRLAGKVMKQVDDKTWVYVNPDEDPIDPKSLKKTYEERDEVKQGRKVIVDGKTYDSVRSYCQQVGRPFSQVYAMLRGEAKNTIGIKLAIFQPKGIERISSLDD